MPETSARLRAEVERRLRAPPQSGPTTEPTTSTARLEAPTGPRSLPRRSSSSRGSLRASCRKSRGSTESSSPASSRCSSSSTVRATSSSAIAIAARASDTPGFSRARRVAAVIFLNGEGDPSVSDGYRGGALTLYGLFEQPDAETLGFPLEAEEGLLVTFPADVTHEVRPVEAGERYTVVTWFE